MFAEGEDTNQTPSRLTYVNCSKTLGAITIDHGLASLFSTSGLSLKWLDFSGNTRKAAGVSTPPLTTQDCSHLKRFTFDVAATKTDASLRRLVKSLPLGVADPISKSGGGTSSSWDGVVMCM